MELILQNDLEHQQRPVMNVASVIETSNVSEATAPHRNPEIYRWSLNSKTIYDIWVKEDIPHKYRRFVNNPNNVRVKKVRRYAIIPDDGHKDGNRYRENIRIYKNHVRTA